MSQTRKTSFKIVLAYFLICVIWIYLSDQSVENFHDHELGRMFGTINALAFITVSSVLLFFQIKKYCTIIDNKQIIQLRQEKLYRAIIDNGTDIITLTDIKGRVVYISDNVCQYFNYTPTDILDKYYLKFIHPGDHEAIKKIMGTLLEMPDKTFTVEMRIQNKCGKYIWVECSLINKYYDAQLCAIVGNTRIITEKKAKEQIIKDNEQLFTATFEQATVGLSIKNMEGNWIRINKKLSEITGYSYDELVDVTFQDISHPDDNIEDLRLYSILIAGKIEHYSLNKRIIMKNKTVIWITKTVSLIKDDLGHPLYILTAIHDITDRIKTEQLLLYRNKELDTFIYRSSHDLRGPIATLLGLTVVAKIDLTYKKAMEYFDNVSQVATKMDRLLGDLMAVAHIRHNKINVREVDIFQLINEIKEKYVTSGHDYPYNMEIENQPSIFFNTDPILLKKLLKNLVDNAIKFRKKDTDDHKIFLNVFYANSEMHFVVRDNGIGIAPEQHEKIFDLYYKGKHTYEGNGVGLYVVKAAVDKLNGSISVFSKENEGTEIRVIIPDCCN